MQAHCTNCDHLWTLRKEPDQYSGGSPDCPSCGSTKVQPANKNQQPAQAPTTTEQSQDTGGELANTGMASDFAFQAGSQIANLRNASPEEKAQTEGMVWEMAGQALSGFGKKMAQEKMEGIDRAKQYEGELQKKTEYPECPECDGQITNLPEQGTEFGCPHCSARLVA